MNDIYRGGPQSAREGTEDQKQTFIARVEGEKTEAQSKYRPRARPDLWAVGSEDENSLTHIPLERGRKMKMPRCVISPC